MRKKQHKGACSIQVGGMRVNDGWTDEWMHAHSRMWMKVKEWGRKVRRMPWGACFIQVEG